MNLGTSATDTSLWKLNYDFGGADNNGNVKQQTTTVPSINPLLQTFTYDSLNRLKSAQETVAGNQTFKQTFTYDRYGNRNFDAANTTTLGSCPVNQCNPTVDVNTNRFAVGQGYTYDLSGNIITDAQGRQFTFNGDNKQTQVKDSANNVIGTYSYDGDGKRIKKITNSENTTFVYSGGKLVAEYLLTTATPQAPVTQYITTDMLGSPRVISDGNGNIISRRDFMPFGEELSNIGGRSASVGYTTDNVRQKFTGYQRDNETNLDFAEARYYNSAHGRFTAVDPLLASGKSANPQTFNRYAYSLNNPLVMNDPTGMQVGTHVGKVYANESETSFSSEEFEGSHQFQGGKYVNAIDGFTYGMTRQGFYSIGNTVDIKARGISNYEADSEMRGRAIANNPLLPSTYIPELMIDPPGYEEAAQTSGGREEVSDFEAAQRNGDTNKVMGIAATTQYLSLGGFRSPPGIGQTRGTSNLSIGEGTESGFIGPRPLEYAPRVRDRAVEDPLSHNFPYSFDNLVLSAKPIFKPNGYRIFQQTGTMNRNQGVFEIGVTKDFVIDNRFFRHTGRIP